MVELGGNEGGWVQSEMSSNWLKTIEVGDRIDMSWYELDSQRLLLDILNEFSIWAYWEIEVEFSWMQLLLMNAYPTLARHWSQSQSEYFWLINIFELNVFVSKLWINVTSDWSHLTTCNIQKTMKRFVAFIYINKIWNY